MLMSSSGEPLSPVATPCYRQVCRVTMRPMTQGTHHISISPSTSISLSLSLSFSVSLNSFLTWSRLSSFFEISRVNSGSFNEEKDISWLLRKPMYSEWVCCQFKHTAILKISVSVCVCVCVWANLVFPLLPSPPSKLVEVCTLAVRGDFACLCNAYSSMLC